VVAEAGVAADAITIERTASARFARQINEISFDLPPGELAADAAAEIASRFTKAYTDLYGHAHSGIPVEIMTWRIVASGRLAKVAMRRHDPEPGAVTAPRGRRPAYWAEASGYVDTPVYDRYALAPDTRIHGPALVEERESTALVPPGSTGRIDGYRNMIVTRNDGKEQ
jgi:N-methylhydantoinase A